MSSAFAPGVALPSAIALDALWFLVAAGGVLVLPGDGGPRVPSGHELPAALRQPGTAHYLGALDGRPCLAAWLDDGAPLPRGGALRPLRSLFGDLDTDLFAVAGRAVQIVDWDRNHRFCGRCATPTERQRDERARRCPACGLSAYPRLAPAVITLVRRAGQILLARGVGFPAGLYSILAGFVDPGESLEEAVVREIREEVGIEVANVRYFGSQPWPYPHSLMVGFTADHAGGELRPDRREIEEAAWFAPDALPTIPSAVSISRRLIEAWLEEQRA